MKIIKSPPNMPVIAIPAAARHLSAFRFAREQDDRAEALAHLVDFKTTLAECENPPMTNTHPSRHSYERRQSDD